MLNREPGDAVAQEPPHERHDLCVLVKDLKHELFEARGRCVNAAPARLTGDSDVVGSPALAQFAGSQI